MMVGLGISMAVLVFGISAIFIAFLAAGLSSDMADWRTMNFGEQVAAVLMTGVGIVLSAAFLCVGVFIIVASVA